jgi:hypothetical protein
MRKLAEKADALLALHQPQTHDINAIAASSVAAVNVQPSTGVDEDTVAAASAGKGGQGGKKKKKREAAPAAAVAPRQTSSRRCASFM